MQAVTITQISPNELTDIIRATVAETVTNVLHRQTSSRQPTDEILSVDEAAAFLRLAKQTVYELNSKGELASMKKGKRLYFLRADLVNYLKSGRRKTNDETAKEVDRFLSSTAK